MTKWLPCKRRIFIKKLQRLGFKGPYSGTRHLFMTYEQHRMTIPSNDEYSVPQLRMMLNEIGNIISRSVSLDEWNDLP